MYQNGLRRIGIVMLVLAIVAPVAAATDVREDPNRWAISAWADDLWTALAGLWTNESPASSGGQHRDSEAKDGEPSEDGPDAHQRHYLQIEPGG